MPCGSSTVSDTTIPNVKDIKIDNLPKFRDARGNLVVAKFCNYVPFPGVRLFYIHDVSVNTLRGKHAHTVAVGNT
jgi:WxcM-like, C-terminal